MGVRPSALRYWKTGTVPPKAKPHPLSGLVNGGKAGADERMKQWPYMRHFGPDMELHIDTRHGGTIGKVRESDSSASSPPTWISTGGRPARSPRTGEVKGLSGLPSR